MPLTQSWTQTERIGKYIRLEMIRYEISKLIDEQLKSYFLFELWLRMKRSWQAE